ncbi:MAG TPA: ATP-binding protein [Tenuifilaceae bacterium]|nr:ATP-binding protein [Tenuifilaceae bacterium]HPE18516.1 ATP-binding protein [Tenuifilaceae bacterium]HPJ46821.1 ATP-binding protein [Tenuifilaceae bacterium]HPQ35380.1 ATP-binding protein [Tenuifilaceae bacterium]HRX69196.1 ATP-binding protein [Tenuifilaceae bacterium]
MFFDYEIIGGDFSNAGQASSSVKKVLKQLNVDPKVIKRVVVCLYEAEVNVVAHAFSGKIFVDIDTERIVMRLQDTGPGIPDIPMAMQMGYSTASAEVREMGFGAGMGLPNINNNADEFKINSIVGEGTNVEIVVYFDGESYERGR